MLVCKKSVIKLLYIMSDMVIKKENEQNEHRTHSSGASRRPGYCHMHKYMKFSCSLSCKQRFQC